MKRYIRSGDYRLSPSAEYALQVSRLWIARAQECQNVEEFCEKYIPRAIEPENFKELFNELNENIVYSGERRLNKGAMDTNRLFTRQAALILVKSGLAELVDEYRDGTVTIRILK